MRMIHTKALRLALLAGVVALLLAATGSASGLKTRAQVLDAQSTTGPTPPPGVETASGMAAASPQAVVISGVPSYTWHHGCGPTAAGMVMGYWDGQGFDGLVPGDAITQTEAVDEMIASEGPASNYTDYCLPIDSYPNLEPDKSEDPPGDEHSDECVADYMKTSQSYFSNYYGWSWFSDMGPAMGSYAESVAGHPYPTMTVAYTATVSNLFMGSSLTWDVFRGEIDAGRPVVLLVDTDGNGGTDHFVTAIGYDDAGPVPQYACYDTWYHTVRWEEFAQMVYDQDWGIFGAVTFQIWAYELPERVYLPTVLRNY